jgi:flagellar basal body-associated protein FliL
MTKDHPAVQTLQERINIMEKRIRETPDEIDLQTVTRTGGGGEVYTAMLAAAQAEVEILTSERDRVETQVEGYAKMNKDLEIARKEYVNALAAMETIQTQAKSWRDRLRQVEMALAAEKEGLRVLFNTDAIQWAHRPQMPARPSLPIVVGVALGGGLMFGAMMIFAFHRKDRSLTSSELTESYLGVPVYGVISESLTLRQRASRKLLGWILLLIVLALMAISAGGLVLRLYRPQVPDFLKPLQKMIYLVTEPTWQPETKPTTQTTTQPAMQPTTQPVTQATTKPTTQVVTQPATQLTTQPASQSTTRPSSQPITQPTSRPTTTPATQPTISAGRVRR